MIAIIDGGWREVREIYRTSRWPARPCLRPTGGPAQKCASAPRALPGTPDGQSSPGCDCRGVGGAVQLVVLFGREAL